MEVKTGSIRSKRLHFSAEKLYLKLIESSVLQRKAQQRPDRTWETSSLSWSLPHVLCSYSNDLEKENIERPLKSPTKFSLWPLSKTTGRTGCTLENIMSCRIIQHGVSLLWVLADISESTQIQFLIVIKKLCHVVVQGVSQYCSIQYRHF